MERAKFEYNKISDAEDKRLTKMLERVKSEIPYSFTVEETTDTLMVRRNDPERGKVGMGFTKVGDKIPVNGVEENFSDVVEASIKYPNEKISDALKKMKEERKEKNTRD
ncbi:MAG: hypothetical protein AB1333_00550 [Patescibacteria group bacterium]